MKMLFAIDCPSKVVNGVTILEVESAPVDIRDLNNIVEHIKNVLAYLPHSEIHKVVDELTEANERMLLSNMIVHVNESDIDDKRVKEIVNSKYAERFKP